MLTRVLEPEVMDTAQEAADYDSMDHAVVNAAFVADLLAFWPGRDGETARVLDVGTGTAQIPLALVKAMATGGRRHAQVTGVDLAEHMLAQARANIRAAAADAHVTVRLGDAKALEHAARYDAVISNSVVHHIPAPGPALASMLERVAVGGVLFVRDLVRPSSREALDALVARHSGSRPSDAGDATRWDRQRDLFAASLHAALTLDEVRECVAPLGIAAGDITLTSDRHWTLQHRREHA